MAAVLSFWFMPFSLPAVFDTVIVDPGHGGWDRGGLRGVKLPEKTLTLKTSLVLREKLEAAGLKVIMTRETDVYIPLSDRCEIANAHDDAIFVSVHYNATYGSSGNGIETYSARGSSKSIPLRDAIHRQLIKRTGARNRFTRTAGFYVLRHTESAAVLVEGGFMSNPREAKKLATDEYRELIADCIAEGILDYRDKLNGSALPRKKKQPEKPAEESKEDEKKADEKKDDEEKQDDEDSQEKSSSMPKKSGR
jgi:N-acetylmuramoyl-L-alanine amidase